MNILSVFIYLFMSPVTLCSIENSVLYQEVFTYHNNTAEKAKFAYEVVDKIYNAFHEWFFTITYCDFTYFENRILKYTETYGYGYPVVLLNGCPNTNRTKIKPKLNKHGSTVYLVTSSELNLDMSDFSIEAVKKTGVFKPRRAVVFIISEPVKMNEYFYYILRNHFQLLWSRSVTNSVIILKSDSLKMYTYNPYFDEVRDITDNKNLGQLLLKQYNNLYGQQLRLSVFKKIYVNNTPGPVLCDSSLAKTVMSFLNASCLPLAPRDGSTVGDLLDNGTATGVTADLLDGYTDLELSSRILKNSFYGYIDTTYALTQDELCFLVKNSERQSTFTTTVNLVSVQLLLTFLFIVILCILLSITIRLLESEIWGLENKQTAGATAIELIKCFIRQTADIQFWGPVYRFLIMMVILYSVIVDCIIDGFIFSALQEPRFKQNLNSLPELINSDLIIGVHNRDYKLFVKSLNPDQYKIIEKRIEIVTDHKIKEVIEKRQFQYALLLRKSDAEYISKKLDNLHNGRGLFYVVPDCPVPCFIVYGLRYGNPYLTRINYILDHLNQGGILKHWSESEEYSLQRKLSSTDKKKKPLDMENLQELFYMMLIGLLISFLVFILEIVLYSLWRHAQRH